MAISLKEAIYCSEKGYIDRAEDIRDIMEHLTRLTLRELNAHCGRDFLDIFEVGLEMCNIPTSYLGSMTYTEMLCVTYSIKFDYRFKIIDDLDSLCRLCYIGRVGEALMMAKNTCPWVKLYLSTGVKAYMDFLAEQSEDLNGNTMYAALTKRVSGIVEIEMSDSTTIGELVKGSVGAMKDYWDPMVDIKEYSNKIYAAYELLDMTLMSGMEAVYKKQFSLAQIRRNAITIEKIKQAQTSIERSM